MIFLSAGVALTSHGRSDEKAVKPRMRISLLQAINAANPGSQDWQHMAEITSTVPATFYLRLTWMLPFMPAS